jgi:hypothetical protein
VNDILDQVLGDPIVTTIGWAVGGALLALWLAAAWWAYIDAGRRTDSALGATLAATWVVVATPLLFPLALTIYALVRPQQTAAERRTRILARELVDELQARPEITCLSCGAEVDPAWLRCPSCTTWLALPCARCGAWGDRDLPICPMCGNEDRAEPAVESLEPAATSGRPRRGRRPMRAMGPGAAPARPGQRRLLAPDGRPLAPLRVR